VGGWNAANNSARGVVRLVTTASEIFLVLVFTRATLCVERVLATATCLAVCLSVCHSWYCIKTETASVVISSPSDSPMTSLSGEV